MKGKVCIITGSNSGIGKETALALAGRGARVVMAVRSQERGEKARQEIIDRTGNRRTDLMICDMSSMESIRNFSKRFKSRYKRLDVLINNAGVSLKERQTTVDGFEQTLAVNYLGPFLLTHELLPILKKSAPSRVINVSSDLYRTGRIDISDLQSRKGYSGIRAYSNSKLMLLMYTYYISSRLKGTGVTVNALTPGFVATNFGKNSGSLLSSIGFKLMRPFQISAKKGAETSVYLASSDKVKSVSGKCFSKKKEIVTSAISYNQKVQKHLWDKTIELLKLKTSI